MTGQRIGTIDVVRGFAVLGILLMNIVSFGLPSAAYVNPEVAGGTDALNLGVWAASYILVDGKMRALFAMLFGASMLLIAERAGEGAPGRHAARMAVLLLIGIAHGWLVWQGDILTYYALIGLLVFPARRLKPRTLLLVAAAAMLLQAGLHLSGAWQIARLEAAAAAPGASEATRAALREMTAVTDPAPARVEAEIAAFRGSWADAFAARRAQLGFFYSFLFPFVFLLETAAQMLMGMALFRLGFWQGAWPVPLYRRVALLVPLGAAAMALLAWRYFASGFAAGTYFTGEAARVLVGPFIAMGYAALLIAWAAATASPLRDRLAAVGRMALSNYLLSSLLATFLFNGFGLGLFATLERWQLLPVVVAIWALLLLWSKPWLERFAQGPAEWLWRTLARGRAQPFRRPLPAQ